ncbi:hypothetical protein [Nocardia sp. NPDC056100]|uniref:hypothetical protein n=1 Tax=Nocardia sp. NPDC056100 TaxID=3345712 RepID=UPI0035E11A3F
MKRSRAGEGDGPRKTRRVEDEAPEDDAPAGEPLAEPAPPQPLQVGVLAVDPEPALAPIDALHAEDPPAAVLEEAHPPLEDGQAPAPVPDGAAPAPAQVQDPPPDPEGEVAAAPAAVANLQDNDYPQLNMPHAGSERATEVDFVRYAEGERILVVDPTGTKPVYFEGAIFDAEDEEYLGFQRPRQVLADMRQWATPYQADTYYYGRPADVDNILLLNVATLITGLRQDLQGLAGRIRTARDQQQGLDTVATVGQAEAGLLTRITSLVEGIDKASVLKPIEVTVEGDGHAISDGNHRVIASMYRGLLRIPARVATD